MGLDQYAGTMREKVYKYTTPEGEKKEENIRWQVHLSGVNTLDCRVYEHPLYGKK